jgi:hypothetical protein
VWLLHGVTSQKTPFFNITAVAKFVKHMAKVYFVCEGQFWQPTTTGVDIF